MARRALFTPERRPLDGYSGRRVTVMGLGAFGGGRGVVEFLCRHGARVTVSDLKPAGDLEPSLSELKDLPVRWVLGEHRIEDFLDADLVVVNPAVPRDAPILETCRDRGVPLETEMNLFFKHARGKICAVTGSNGKTTTTRLVGAMAARCFPGLRVGGNLGRSLLPEAERIREDEWIVLELSSFQLEDLAALDRRPEVAVITNLSPNHLDRHGTYEAYLRAKRTILEPGPPPAIAVLSGEDARLRAWSVGLARRTLYFGRTGSVVPRAPGVWYAPETGEVFLRSGNGRRVLFSRKDLSLRGSFNVINAAAAAAAAMAMGAGDRDVHDAVRGFRPVPHRLEHFLTAGGVEHFDDSISTTPESSVAALEALGPRVVLICGGSPKATSYAALGRAISRLSKAVCLIGATAGEIERAVLATRRPPPLERAGDLDRAVEAARRFARPGDRILLSPACPSYDQFANFEERGRRFKALCIASGGSGERGSAPSESARTAEQGVEA